jgi:mono/diheme cytochrome c family protein
MPASASFATLVRRALLVVALSTIPAVAGVSAEAPSSPRPFWTEQAMFRFGEELYFVGVASCARTPEEGRARAFDNALNELRGYARDRDTSQLLVATQMIYEEPNSPPCPVGSTSVWRLLRVDQSKLVRLPRTRREIKAAREHPLISPDPPLPELPERHEPVDHDLTPQTGMSRAEIRERFGAPDLTMKEGRREVWKYSGIGLTITFNPDETLFNWKFEGAPTADPRSSDPSRSTLRNESAGVASPPSPIIPAPQPPPQAAPEGAVSEGRKLFNGKGGCSICHGRDADMSTDVERDLLFGTPPGYMPFPFTPLGGLYAPRVPPNLRDWSALKLRTDLEMARAIKHGIAGTTMTATRHLSDAEISALIAYLNSIR